MENAKREWPPVRRPRKRRANLRPVALILALVLLVGGVVGGTIAWLTDKSAPVTNTFTAGNINIELTETGTDTDGKKSFKMIPGETITKDPTVTVKANSEACWLFVKIEKSAVLDKYITYAVADGWTKLDGNDGVYYRQVTATTADTPFAVLKDDQVTVNADVTKADMDALTDTNQPTLTFTAYAIQQASFADATAAWTKASE